MSHMNQVILYQIDFQNVTIVDKYLNRTIPFNLVMEKILYILVVKELRRFIVIKEIGIKISISNVYK